MVNHPSTGRVHRGCRSGTDAATVEAVTKLRVHSLAVSLDGFATGEGQAFDAPFGHAGSRLMSWFFPTRTFVSMTGHDAEVIGQGTTGVDDTFAAAGWVDIGAEIMGRRKFGPQQGPWQDDGWQGWWGDEPPFHTPVVVLTHHEREDLTLGETTFLFRDASPQAALELASELAGWRVSRSDSPSRLWHRHPGSCTRSSRAAPPERSPRPSVSEYSREQRPQCAVLVQGEWLRQAFVRRIDPWPKARDLVQAAGGEAQRVAASIAAVRYPLDDTSPLETRDDIGDRGPVEVELAPEFALTGAGHPLEDSQGCVLDAGDVLRHQLLPQRCVPLLGTPDEVAGVSQRLGYLSHAGIRNPARKALRSVNPSRGSTCATYWSGLTITSAPAVRSIPRSSKMSPPGLASVANTFS